MVKLLTTLSVECILLVLLPLVLSDWIRKNSRFNQWSLKKWWVIFLGASVADVGSTYIGFLFLFRAVDCGAQFVCWLSWSYYGSYQCDAMV